MGIFASKSNLFTRYRATLEFKDRLMGGVPKDPHIIEGWIRSKAGITDDTAELRVMLLRTMAENGAVVNEDMSMDELEQASKELAAVKETTGFKRGEHGLYVEARQVKAMLKESTNVLFADERWGPTRKGPRSFLAERVFVTPDQLWLGRAESDGIQMVVGHIVDKSGPRSTLGYHEFVRHATITFDVLSTRDAIKPEWWADIWNHAEENGLGALRSQGYGRFDIVAWDQVDSLGQEKIPEAFHSALK